MKTCFYILRSRVKETYYIGISNDPERRLFFHNNGNKGHTKRDRPWELVFKQEFDSKEAALATETKIKSWKSKKMIRLLIEGEIKLRDYLISGRTSAVIPTAVGTLVLPIHREARGAQSGRTTRLRPAGPFLFGRRFIRLLKYCLLSQNFVGLGSSH